MRRLLWRWGLRACRSARPLGERGERAAAKLLRRTGHRVLARNLRRRLGEIDILAAERGSRAVLVVEVKTTVSDDPPPEVHVDAPKQRKLTALAGHIVREFKLEDRPIRFDVVAVVWPEGAAKPTRITHHRAAFEAAF